LQLQEQGYTHWQKNFKISSMAFTNRSNKTTPQRTTILIAVCWLVWLLLYSTIINQFDIATATAITDGLVSNILLAAICLFIINNMRYYLPKKEKYWYVLFMSFALSAVWLALSRLVLKIIFKLDEPYLIFLKQSLVLRYLMAFFIIACNTLLSLLWYTQKDEQEENERKTDIEKIAREAELNKLRQQLQPHFLFNSLNSISALTGQYPEKARYMIQQLSDFLRGTLRNETHQWIMLKDELAYLNLYLDIEKVRFGYRLQTTISCDEATLNMQLPSMLVQPLVENAIKFGLYDTIGEVTILITSKKIDNTLQLCIQNPFDECTAMFVKGTGFGLASVRRRLFLLYGRQNLLQIIKKDNQFIALLNIPDIALKNDSSS
jgi:sensor histidine kinase YesM